MQYTQVFIKAYTLRTEDVRNYTRYQHREAMHAPACQYLLMVSFRFARRTASATGKTSNVVLSPRRLSGLLRVVELGGPTDDKVHVDT